MKVMVVIGTRPEAIKMAPVILALRARHVDTLVVSSGQHSEMLAQALGFFGIVPDMDSAVMQPGQVLNGLASRIIAAMDPILETTAPDWVLVQGDTTTAFCAALAAFHRGIPVGHVEAGLRTGNLNSPFPEEANRSLISRIATRHFAPTERAAANLRAEALSPADILVTGNTVVDAIECVLPADRRKSVGGDAGQAASDVPQILVTCHRRENFGEVMLGICHMLRRLCERFADYQWVFPVHLNPAVRAPVMRELAGIGNLRLIDPVPYPESLALIAGSVLIVSDSGGIQEEAPTFGVPVVVMRTHTEREEGVTAGFATLAGQTPADIEAAVAAWLTSSTQRAALRERPNPYGDGHAADRIVSSLLGQTVEPFLA